MDGAPLLSAAPAATKTLAGAGIDPNGPEPPARIPPFGYAKNPNWWAVCRPTGCPWTIVGPFRPPILGCFFVVLPPAPSATTGDHVSRPGVVGVRNTVGVWTTVGVHQNPCPAITDSSSSSSLPKPRKVLGHMATPSPLQASRTPTHTGLEPLFPSSGG